jgi:hypothetical protein
MPENPNLKIDIRVESDVETTMWPTLRALNDMSVALGLPVLSREAVRAAMDQEREEACPSGPEVRKAHGLPPLI